MFVGEKQVNHIRKEAMHTAATLKWGNAVVCGVWKRSTG